MPLKHKTETRLIWLLMAVIALVGLLIASLPPLPRGIVPWAILLTATVIYPLVLYPLFRRDRADRPFRLLHWFPALMVVLWAVLQSLGSLVPATKVIGTWFTWSWTLAAVVVAFGLITWFCLLVIRRRIPRLVGMALLLVPFTALAVASQQKFHWEDQIAAVLWQDDSAIVSSGTGVIAAEPDRNLDPSEDPKEEAWRTWLRAVEKRRQDRLARLEQEENDSESETSASSSSTSAASSEVAALPDSLKPGGSGTHQVSSSPSQLPHSGMEWGFISTLMLAGYTTVMQRRVKKS